MVLLLGEWTACKFPHKTITVSRGLQNYCLQRYNAPTTYIPNGVYIRTQPLAKKILNEYDLRPGGYFLVVARFIKHKRIDDVIRAFRLIKNREMRLVIIGDSSFTDKYAGLIRDLAATDKRIIFTGWQTGDRLWTLIQRARALVSASEDEGMPITVLEAMSLGTPVVLSDIVGHHDATAGCFARYFAVGDITELKKQLQQIWRSSAQLSREAKLNQKLIRENYNWSTITQALVVVYAQEFVFKRAWQNSLF
jgi:glycosyltransferase involved in cell wall biosynthesis